MISKAVFQGSFLQNSQPESTFQTGKQSNIRGQYIDLPAGQIKLMQTLIICLVQG